MYKRQLHDFGLEVAQSRVSTAVLATGFRVGWPCLLYTSHQLGAVGPLDAHVFLFILINLAMHKTVGGPASGPAYPPHRAGLFGGLLFCQRCV